MVVALHEAEHIKGLVADTHSHFCDDIPSFLSNWLTDSFLSNILIIMALIQL